jgi:hypothetical protein
VTILVIILDCRSHGNCFKTFAKHLNPIDIIILLLDILTQQYKLLFSFSFFQTLTINHFRLQRILFMSHI